MEYDEWKVREDSKPGKFGKLPSDRTIEEIIRSSVIIIDKHSGPTSHQITKWVAEIFGTKAGHAGTLDPGVTGVLPTTIGDARKVMPVLMGVRKEYVGVMRVHDDLPVDEIKEKARQFVGKIMQRPPIKSAVSRNIREREIYFFDIVEVEGRDVLFHVGCEAGTYIRKLCHDFGESIGCGAHMTELRRVKAGMFNESEATPLVKVKDAYEMWKEKGDESNLRGVLIPIEEAITHVKRIVVKDSAVDAICNGSPVYVAGVSKTQNGVSRGDIVAVCTLKGELVAIGISKMTSDEIANSAKGAAVRTDRVFMERGTYPSEKHAGSKKLKS